MGELRQPALDSQADETKGRHIAVRVGPKEVRYFESTEDLAASISQEDIQRGLDLAGAWSDLDISEEEMLQALDRIRNGSGSTPPMTPE